MKFLQSFHSRDSRLVDLRRIVQFSWYQLACEARRNAGGSFHNWTIYAQLSSFLWEEEVLKVASWRSPVPLQDNPNCTAGTIYFNKVVIHNQLPLAITINQMIFSIVLRYFHFAIIWIVQYIKKRMPIIPRTFMTIHPYKVEKQTVQRHLCPYSSPFIYFWPFTVYNKLNGTNKKMQKWR